MISIKKPFITQSLPDGYPVVWTIDHPFDRLPRFFICLQISFLFFSSRAAVEVK